MRTLLVKLSHLICFQHRQCLSTTRPLTSAVYDVIVSGGGMVGAAMTAALGSATQLSNRRILMLEGGPEKRLDSLPTSYSSRTVALSTSTVELLTEIGAWSHILDMRCQAVKRMQVWDACSDSSITFNHDDLLNDLAYIVENDVVQEGIRRSHGSRAENVEIRYNTKIKGYSLPDREAADPWAKVHLEDGQTLCSSLLIGADGFRSLIRQTANFHTLQWEYNQMAVVATLKLSEPTENNVAWQRFLTTGPIALLPLTQEHSCLIWSTTPDDAKNLLRLDHDSFVDAVNHAFWSDEAKDQLAVYANKLFDQGALTLGLENRGLQQLPPTLTGVDTSSKAAFPLGFLHSSHYVLPRVALIGDAAHRCHPMAGQGVNLGFGDVTCLLQQLSSAVDQGADLGSIQHLLLYETLRQQHVVPTLLGIDALYRLYGTSWTPLVLARSVGLQATDALSPLKSFFLEHAAR